MQKIEELKSCIVFLGNFQYLYKWILNHQKNSAFFKTVYIVAKNILGCVNTFYKLEGYALKTEY